MCIRVIRGFLRKVMSTQGFTWMGRTQGLTWSEALSRFVCIRVISGQIFSHSVFYTNYLIQH